MKELNVKFNGISPLLLNNPQMVDVFNGYSKEMKKITNKRSKTDEDHLAISDIEMKAKIYWDDELGIYVPSRWLLAAFAKISFKTVKISKDNIRAGVFVVQDKAKLEYRGVKNVKTAIDVTQNPDFRHRMILPQQKIRIAKTTPIFHDWSFEFDIEFDDKIIDDTAMEQLLHHMGKYGGFGDFRPTFGRALAEVKHA